MQDQRLDQLFTVMQEDHQNLNERVGNLEIKVDKGFKETREELHNVNEKIALMDRKMDRGFDRVDEKFYGVNEKLEEITNILKTDKEEHKKIEKRLTKLEQVRV